ncbi:hypothetical protein BV25DRAFT_1917439 [Artomyces pyxidatus]|uniref:Uncharacterized protein n=1 Tax=Artomyces pyxidatus TaxID=48021 RepID=A0ACB8SWT9_9AGAM|nr:hypothetical protein BV25DRAFT_1917439 [Artomyces pyxidatus]
MENLILLYPPKKYLLEMAKLLESFNREWDKAVETDPRAERTIDWQFRCLDNPFFEILLLHPSLFLPRQEPLIAVDPDTFPDRASPDSPPYPPSRHVFRALAVCDDRDYVNPLLVILNAGLKLERHKTNYSFGALTPRQCELDELTLKAYNLMYYRPSTDKTGSAPSTDEQIAPTHHDSVPDPAQTTTPEPQQSALKVVASTTAVSKAWDHSDYEDDGLNQKTRVRF